MEDGVTLVIRRATAEDAGAMAQVLREAFVEYEAIYTPGGLAATTPPADRIRERLDEGPAWVALLNNAMVGTVAAVRRGAGVYVRSMAVLPGARGHGIGAALLRAAERFAREIAADHLFLSTTPFLASAIHLYERFGFRRTAEGPQDLHGTPLFTMVKLTTDH